MGGILVLLLGGIGHIANKMQSALAGAVLIFPTTSTCFCHLDWTLLPSKAEAVLAGGVRGNPKAWGGLRSVPSA